MADLAGESGKKPASLRTVVTASSAGTAFEWYDFFVFGSLTHVISKTFFSGLPETAGYIAALALFGAGFLFRPLGALVFGRIGDKAGRKGAFLVTVVLMGAAIAGYLIAINAGHAWGSPAGIFLSALVLTAAGNAFGRWMHRPGAVIRLPGIIMLVPGSASLRGLLTLVQQQDVDAGQSALLLVTNIVMALVAGLLFGNLLIPARKNL